MPDTSFDAQAAFNLTGETAVVTGAGAGIGRGVALACAAAGAKVVAADLNAEGAEKTAALITQKGGDAVAAAADIADPDGPAQIVETTFGAFGRLDILINNAGIYPRGTLMPEVDWPTLEQTYNVNIFGTIRCTEHAAARMSQGGRIINISSMESLRPSGPGNAYYSSTKAAINALTRQWAVDLAERNIRVNAILPGLIKTEGMHRTPQAFLDHVAARAPSRRIGQPDDIAGAVLFLAAGASSYVNGQCLVVDGGLTIAG